MPDDSDAFPTADDLMRQWQQDAAPTEKAPTEQPKTEALTPKTPQLTPDQQKAISLILSGLPFVCIAIRETTPPGETQPTGADFLISIDGKPSALLAVKEHLQGVVDRAYLKRGLM